MEVSLLLSLHTGCDKAKTKQTKKQTTLFTKQYGAFWNIIGNCTKKKKEPYAWNTRISKKKKKSMVYSKENLRLSYK